MNANKIPDNYYWTFASLRALQHMQDMGLEQPHHKELGESVGISAAQIAKIFRSLANLANKARSYSIEYLIKQLPRF